MEEQIQTNSRFNFNKIFEYCLLTLVFLVPIMFFPSTSVSLYASKLALLVTVIVIFISVFLASTLSTGVIVFPKSKFLIPIAVFPLLALISSFFSGETIKSIAGEIFELGTTGSLFILSMLLFFAIFAVKEEATIGIKTIYAFLLSSVVVIVHLLVRAFAIPMLPANVIIRIPNFLVGGTIDTAILLGAVCVASLPAINMLSLSNKVRYALYVLLIVSMIFIGAIGFMPIIIVIGLFALVYFVYTFSWAMSSSEQNSPSHNKASFPSIFVLAISLVFILSGGDLSNYLSNIFKLNSIEVRPNIETTINLVGEAWKKNAPLGVGPNMFKELWDLKKPKDINLTQFWASEFNFGSGFVPTMAATTGILGLFSLIAFFVLYAHSGFKAIFSLTADPRFRYVSSTSFFISLFLWVMTFVYVPSITIMALTFIFTGVFAGTLVSQGVVQNFQTNIFRNPKSNFASVFMIIVFLIASIAFGYFVWERVIAASIFQKGSATNSIRLVSTDFYWRGFSENSLSQIGTIINSVSSVENLNESQKVAIQTAISDAIEGAKQAIAWNAKNYQNWFALGRVYEVLAANGIVGAAQNAKDAYTEAQNRTPLNPGIPLAFARLAALSGDLAEARMNIGKAIEMKSNYTDAYFTLAQLEAAANNIPGAIQSVEAATFIDSQNTVLYFQLGLLKYNNKDYAGASKAFERAVELIPDYANARYFLGLSYEKLNKNTDAILQFETIQKTNSDNNEIKLILSNLKAGRSPFANAKPPVDDKPEKRAEPPIEEN